MTAPWAPAEPGPRVPYWLRPRDPAIERRHVELMRRFEQANHKRVTG